MNRWTNGATQRQRKDAKQRLQQRGSSPPKLCVYVGALTSSSSTSASSTSWSKSIVKGALQDGHSIAPPSAAAVSMKSRAHERQNE